MGRISNKDKYNVDTKVTDLDYLIGTNIDDGKTKTYQIKDIREFIQNNGGNGTEGDSEGVPITGALYTWVKWADDNIGTNMTNTPEGKEYIGLAINKNLPESQDPNSDDPTYYFWTKVDETASYIGADGKTYYVWVKYADDENGLNLSDESDGKNYIGLAYNKTLPKDQDPNSSDPTEYEWSLILSDIEREDKLTYVWIKFADSATPTSEEMFDDPAGRSYMGIAVDKDTSEESDDPTDYVWNLIEGTQGYTGADGKTYYVWVKWANSKTPTPEEMSDDPDGQGYMGIATNKETDVESLDYRDYTWSKVTSNNTFDQNNLIRVVEAPSSELTTFDADGIADWINRNPIVVDEDEVVVIKVIDDSGGEVIETPTLDQDISLLAALGAVDETTAVISWNPQGDDAIVRYELYYELLNGGGISKIDFTTELTTTLTGLTSGSPYEVYVVAYDTLGNIKTSNVLNFNTDEVFVPSTPNIQVDDIQKTEVTLSWSVEASFGADRFELYQDTVLIDTILVSSGQGKVVTGLTPSTSYDFYVVAYNLSTPSNPSSTLNVTTLVNIDPPLTAPFISCVGVTESSISYSISIPTTDVSRVTAYETEYRKLGQTSWIQSPVSSVESLQNLKGLDSDTTYEIRVRSTDGNVVSNWSSTLICTTESTLGISIALKLRRLFTQQEIDDGYVGQVTLLNGVPNSVVRIGIQVFVEWDGNQTVGSITFKDLGNTIPSGAPTQFIDVTLDENGEFIDIYKLDNGDRFGTLYEVYGDIITSANTITSGTDNDIFIGGVQQL